MDKVRVMVICFKNELKQIEIPLFRGGVNAVMDNANVLFHDHLEDDRLLYKYPLIQYKRINNKAALVCIQQGTEAIGEFFANCNYNIKIGQRAVCLDIESIKGTQFLIEASENMITYRIRKWLPLNAENYKEYSRLEGLVEQINFLQRILIGNILSFAKGVGVMIDNKLVCNITKILDADLFEYKDVKLMGFDVEFKANIALPDFIGLGQKSAEGFGTICKAKSK